jgi:hypothetical protein
MEKIEGMSDKGSYEIFRSVSQKSFKHEKYFDIYDSELGPYRDRKVTVVEVGVLDGGSLFLWKEFFGPNARIIGIDFNPEAAKWVNEGFEIYIGDQADRQFWNSFYGEVGMVDVLIDDGGHTDVQQITTMQEAIPRIRDGGLIIIEDTHSSMMREFGNPSKYSFLEISKNLVNQLYGKSPLTVVLNNHFSDYVYGINFYESVVILKIDRTKCLMNKEIENMGEEIGNADFREVNQSIVTRKLIATRELLYGNPIFVRKIFRRKSEDRILLLSKYLRKSFGWIVEIIDGILYLVKKIRKNSKVKQILKSSILNMSRDK